jgi:AcrR family transcriptional regulator
MGRRESKKEQTRDDLVAASVSLFIENGFETTTVEDIAAVAHVSPRTFFRYFPTKEDVIVDLLSTGAVDLQEELARRPASECLPDALRAATRRWAELSDERAAQLLRLSQVVRRSPALRVRLDEARLRHRAVLAEQLAERMGVDPALDERPALIATLVMAVIIHAIKSWSERGGAQPLTRFTDAGFDLLECGLPGQPARLTRAEPHAVAG